MTNKTLATLTNTKTGAQKVTRLVSLMTWLKRKARVWSMVRVHGKIEAYPNYLTLLRQSLQKRVIKYLT
jgi:hypothetical protein